MPTGYYVRTKKYREKMSLVNKGKKLSEEHKRKIGDANKNKVRSQDTLKKLSEAQKKRFAMNPRVLSEEAKIKIGNANRKLKIVLSCIYCLSSFKVYPFLAKEQKFCSVVCSRKFYSKDRHHGWKGGTSSLREIIKNSVPYRRWRFSIMKRDYFTCVLCKSVRGKYVEIEVDHFPVTYAEIVRGNKIESLEDAINCNQLWDQCNGRTLCKPCHRNTDTYGYKNWKRIKEKL